MRKIVFLIGALVFLMGAAPSVSSGAAVVVDYDTGEVLFSHNGNVMLNPASITKTMVMLIVFEEIEAGNLTLETQIPISEGVRAFSRTRPQGSSLVPLEAESYSVDDLMKLMMLPSSNAACVAIAEYLAGSEAAFVVRMNETAAAMGMSAVFENSHGGFPNSMTAYSAVILTSTLISRFPQILDYTSLNTAVVDGIEYAQTNLLIRMNFPGVDGFKTGSGPGGYSLSSTAIRGGRRVIAVVLAAPTPAARLNESRRLINFGFAAMGLWQGEIDYHIVTPDSVDINSDFEINAHLLTPDFNFTFNGEWRINGETVATINQTNPEILSLNYFIPLEMEVGGALEVRLVSQGREWVAFIPIGRVAIFRDMAGHFAEDMLDYLYELGVVEPDENSLFNPNNPGTLEELSRAFGRLVMLEQNEVIENYFAWAIANDIIYGELQNLPPAQELNRGLLALLITNFANYHNLRLPSGQDSMGVFADEAYFGWNTMPILSLHQAGIMGGFDDDTFRPTEAVNRAVLYAVVYNLINFEPSEEDEEEEAVFVPIAPVLDDIITEPAGPSVNWVYLIIVGVALFIIVNLGLFAKLFTANARDEAPKARDYFFDNTKFFLIMLVIFGHGMEIVMNRYVMVGYQLIYIFHIPAFALLSGYFFKKQRSENRHKAVLKLMGQYVIFQVLYILVAIHMWGEGIRIGFTQPYWLLWFVFALIAWRIITPYVVKMPYAIVLSAVVAILAGFDNEVGYFMSLSRIFVFYPFFLAGVYLEKSYIDSLKSFPLVRILAVSLFIVSAVGLYFFGSQIHIGFFFNAISYEQMGLSRLLGAGIRAFMMLWSVVLCGAFFALIPNTRQIYTSLGERTNQGYLLHGLFIRTLGAAGIWIFVSGVLNYAIYFLGVIVLSLLLLIKLPDFSNLFVRDKYEGIYAKRD
ncbi:MAG: S-layer homology domain-containing protein [Turicibacter sp.]|nr:S-layer homology domain-containing protein [Turicibacter sp.]